MGGGGRGTVLLIKHAAVVRRSISHPYNASVEYIGFSRHRARNAPSADSLYFARGRYCRSNMLTNRYLL